MLSFPFRFTFFSRPKAPPDFAKTLTVRQLSSEQRKAARALLAAVVTDGMLRTGVLSHQYKFKMLTLDKGSATYSVLVEVAPEAGEVNEYRQGQCEQWVRHAAQLFHEITVVSMYWRRERKPGLLDLPSLDTAPVVGLSETHFAGLEQAIPERAEGF